jgi:hypothetical protein
MNAEKREERMRQEIQLALQWTPGVDTGGVDVVVVAGVVTLSGRVDDVTARRVIEQIIRNMLGVQSVVNKLRIDRPAEKRGVEVGDGPDKAPSIFADRGHRTCPGHMYSTGALSCEEGLAMKTENSSKLFQIEVAVSQHVAPVPHGSETPTAVANHMVIVNESYVNAGIPMKQVHHRDFPELRSEGSQIGECVLRLGHLLECARDQAGSAWRRDAIEAVIRDVNSYAGAGSGVISAAVAASEVRHRSPESRH